MKDIYKYLAEFMGTFFLAMIVAFSVAGTFPVATPVLAGLTLLFFVYTIGKISGSNINPAVSLGLLTRGSLKFSTALIYILVQWIAAVVVVRFMDMQGISLDSDSLAGTNVLLAEALGTAVFGFGIMAVVRGQVDEKMNGLVIGTSLFIGITVAALVGSAGALNPAVAYALGLVTWEYMLGPVLGMAVGMFLYDLFNGEKLVPEELSKEVKKQKKK